MMITFLSIHWSYITTDIMVIIYVYHLQRNKITSILVQLMSLAKTIAKIEMKVEITNWEK